MRDGDGVGVGIRGFMTNNGAEHGMQVWYRVHCI